MGKTRNHFTEKAMAPHSSTLAWKILWTEEPGRLQSMRSLSTFSIIGLHNDLQPRDRAMLVVAPADAEPFELPLIVRLDTPIEKEYFRAGGILQYVLARYC